MISMLKGEAPFLRTFGIESFLLLHVKHSKLFCCVHMGVDNLLFYTILITKSYSTVLSHAKIQLQLQAYCTRKPKLDSQDRST